MNISSLTTIAITGASSGIGADIAREAVRKGASVSLCARRTERLVALKSELDFLATATGARVYIIQADISIEAQAENFITETIAVFGGIDVLIHNAGRGNYGAVEHTTTEQLQSMFSVNVFPLWYMARQALPVMKSQGRGHIIAISSIAGKVGFPFNSAYVSAKHAVIGFIASLRAELLGSNISATALCPSGVLTEWSDVTEGKPIGTLFGEGIKRSRQIAKDHDVRLAPLQPMKTSQEVALQVIECIENPPNDDVYTHEGSREQAIAVATNRGTYEQSMMPLYRGMQEAYTDAL